MDDDCTEGRAPTTVEEAPTDPEPAPTPEPAPPTTNGRAPWWRRWLLLD